VALSKAKRDRLKQEREGKWNPERNRLDWNGLIPVERTTPTLAERKHKQDNKHKKKWNRGLQSSDGSIFHFIKIIIYKTGKFN
jgi:hypothetical protein